MPRGKTSPVTKSVPAFIARTRFGQILERVSRNRDRFLVTRKGEGTAVILGVEDYLQIVVKTPKSLGALQRQARKRRPEKLTLKEIEAEIAAVRQVKRR
jgi:prevent-host-death family protein